MLSMSLTKGIHIVKQVSQRWLPPVKKAGELSEKVFGSPLNCPGSGCPAYKVIRVRCTKVVFGCIVFYCIVGSDYLIRTVMMSIG